MRPNKGYIRKQRMKLIPVQGDIYSLDSAGEPGSVRDDTVPGDFLNRDLSWLEFNRRVLHEAQDSRNPLLARVNFLGIFSSNLDEFFMKRVGGLKRQIDAGVVGKSPDRQAPSQQLTAIKKIVSSLIDEQAECYLHHIKPALTENGIDLLMWEELTPKERDSAEQYFRTNVFPILTPLAVDPGHPFPFISNLSLSLGVTLRHPGMDEKLFARIKVPEVLPKWVKLDSMEFESRFRFVSLLEIVRHNLDDLFPNMVILDVMPFRITRNADLERDEEDVEDLLEMIEREVRERRFAKVVRLEHGPKPDSWMLQFLMQELELTSDDIYEVSEELSYQDLKPISDLNIPLLKYEPYVSVVPPVFADEETDFFTAIRTNSILVHHPYESFTSTIDRFVQIAASDPKVLAIKMTLYRTSEESPFIRTLIKAAESGKQVVCLVELKARFDEERNIYWAHALENAGVHVVYGIVGLKTHTKTTLVVRQDPDGLRCYAHIGTGNYNNVTARLYTDLGLFTCNPDITEDLVEMFHYLTGRSLKTNYRKLIVAPVNMKEHFLEMIDREIAHKQEGRPARIIAKMNSLEELDICKALYRASQAGVEIDLIVRGFCCLRPGVPGLSGNIRVISVIGRFLEHSRIFFFQNGQSDPLDGEFFIGSADWMYRNLLGRVEVVTPIEDKPLREKCWEILQVSIKDHRQAWDMQANGQYVQRTPPPNSIGVEQLGTHQYLIDLTKKRVGR